VPQSPSSSLTVTAAEAVMQQELRIENQDLSSSVKPTNSADKSSKGIITSIVICLVCIAKVVYQVALESTKRWKSIL